jgi:hypothetical protein
MNDVELDNWMWPLHCPFCGKQEIGHAFGTGTGCVHLLYSKDAIGGETVYQSSRLVNKNVEDFPNSIRFLIPVVGYGGSVEVVFAPRESELGDPDTAIDSPLEKNDPLPDIEVAQAP